MTIMSGKGLEHNHVSVGKLEFLSRNRILLDFPRLQSPNWILKNRSSDITVPIDKKGGFCSNLFSFCAQ